MDKARNCARGQGQATKVPGTRAAHFACREIMLAWVLAWVLACARAGCLLEVSET